MRARRFRSLFAEVLWRRNLWMVAALIMAAANLGLSSWLLLSNAREKTIVVPPTLEKSFWVHGDEVSADYLEQMAVYFASLALSYNPDNIRHQITLFLRYADPQSYGALSAELEGDAEKVERNRLASVFYPQEIRIQRRQVALTGQLVTLVGDKQTAQRQTAFLIAFAYRNGRLFVEKFMEVQNRANPFSSDGGAADLKP